MLKKRNFLIRWLKKISRVSIIYLAAFGGVLSFASPSLATDDSIQISFASFEPAIFMDENNIASGLYVEILERIFEKELGINVSYRNVPWARAQMEVKTGKSDLLITVATDARREYAYVSDMPIFQLYLHVITWKGHPDTDALSKIHTVKDLVDLDLKAITNLGNGWFEHNIKSAGVRTEYAHTDELLAGALAKRRADFMIDSPLTMVKILHDNNLKDKIVITPARFGPIDFKLLLGKKSKFATRNDEINEIVTRLYKEGVLDELSQKYLKMK